MKENQSYLARCIGFHEQQDIPMDPGLRTEIPVNRRIGNGVLVQPDGSIAVSFYAPEAKTVEAADLGVRITLNPGENGIWSGTLPNQGPGYRPISFFVDGVYVLNSMAPLGYGACRPMNCVDVPDPEVPEVELLDVPHGSVSREFYRSATTGRWESCLVYTPPGYMKGTQAYPVLYLQHGHGENETCWVWQGKMNLILDNLLAQGRCVPMIVVMNDGMVTVPDGAGGRRLNPPEMEQLLTHDCIPFIESRYRVLSGKENRAMAGLSMGSMQTSITTMSHPELFDYVGIFSGFLHNLFVEPGQEETHLKAMETPAFRESYKLFFRAMGENDPFMSHFLADDELLRSHGLAPERWERHIRLITPGSHEWRCWRICLREFAQMLFRS